MGKKMMSSFLDELTAMSVDQTKATGKTNGEKQGEAQLKSWGSFSYEC
jgi:hypothetical protein